MRAGFADWGWWAWGPRSCGVCMVGRAVRAVGTGQGGSRARRTCFFSFIGRSACYMYVRCEVGSPCRVVHVRPAVVCVGAPVAPRLTVEEGQSVNGCAPRLRGEPAHVRSAAVRRFSVPLAAILSPYKLCRKGPGRITPCSPCTAPSAVR